MKKKCIETPLSVLYEEKKIQGFGQLENDE
jgi:hypothetical protein